MDISDSIRVGEEVAKSVDIFDFVVNSAAAEETLSVAGDGCRSFKSLGIYLESSTIAANSNATPILQCNDDNNNNTTMVAGSCNADDIIAVEKPGDDKCNEQNNNHLLATNGLAEYVQGSSGQYYWASGATAKDQIRWDQSMLEELNCWSQDNRGCESETGVVAERGAADDDNTDGAIYTLTVLNGGNANDSSWYRLATESENRTSTIDIDSLLNNLLPANGHCSQQDSPSDVTCLQMPYQQDDMLPLTKRTSSAKLHPPTAQFVFQDSTFHEEMVDSAGATAIIPSSFNITLKSSTTECLRNNDSNNRCNSSNNSDGSNKNNIGTSNKISNSNSKGSNCSSSGSRCNNDNANDSINNYNNNSSSNNNNNNNSESDGNSSEWKYLTTETNETEARVNSLLRNALQGKSGVGSFMTSRYSGGTGPTIEQRQSQEEGAGGNVPLAMSCSPSCVSLDPRSIGVSEERPPGPSATPSHHMDDLFLSQLDVSSVSYGDDYDKLKSIEHEVATSVEQYCTAAAVACDASYFVVKATSGSGPVAATPHAATHAATLATSCGSPSTAKHSSKRYSSKRCSTASKSDTMSVSCTSSHGHRTTVHSPGHGSGARKERSLHYCTICHKGFKDKYSVNVHVRTHTGEKPFACAFCGKNFRQKAHLAKHHHTHSAHKSSPAAGPPVSTANTNKTHPHPNSDTDKLQR